MSELSFMWGSVSERRRETERERRGRGALMEGAKSGEGRGEVKGRRRGGRDRPQPWSDGSAVG